MGPAGAQIAGSAIEGAIEIAVPPKSDVFLNCPFENPPSCVGRVVEVSGATVRLSVAVPKFAAASAYLRIEGGERDGMWSELGPMNPAGALVLEAGDLARVGDVVSIRPHVVLADLFPPELVGEGFFPSASLAVRATEVFLFSRDVGPDSRAKSETCVFAPRGDEPAAWRFFPSGQPCGSTPIPPAGFLVVRNHDPAQSLSLFWAGSVREGAITQRYGARAGATDVFACNARPVPVPVKALGLAPLFTGADRLLVFDSNRGFNRQPTDRLASAPGSTASGWVRTGPSPAEAGDLVIEPGMGFIIRKAEGFTVSSIWKQEPPF